MVRVRRLRIQRSLESVVLPLICCMTVGKFLLFSESQCHSAGLSAMQSQLLEACAG